MTKAVTGSITWESNRTVTQYTAYSLQVMGQQDVSISDNATIKVTQLPKLASDGENWLTYHDS